jgi:acetylornithine deacetylase/succinyl-diaminopimelate desuccinylase-like protein
MPEPTRSLQIVHQNRDQYLAELVEFLSIPSISTLSAHRPDMQRAAEWVAQQMTQIGLQHVEIIPTTRHPIVYGDWLNAPGQPTVLIYGHYDVQPVDPLAEWTSPPFEAAVRDQNLYARGASDMKGQIHLCLKAVEALLMSDELGVNVKVMVEGEEEIGSPSLESFIEQHRELLKCDIALNPDTTILGSDLPSIVYGLRGMAYFEIKVFGPSRDLHSGVFGGSLHNPAQVLCELIAGLHAADGRITLPGFYDQVRPLSTEERAQLAKLPHSDEDWRQMAGVSELYGEAGFTTIERLGARPTLEVNGLLAGFTGEGAKTVVPAQAMAKLSMRLVPDQDQHAVEGQLKAYLAQHAPSTVRWEVKSIVSAPPVLVKIDTPEIQAAAAALEATFGVKPVFTLEGGSVPVVSMIQAKLGVDSVLMGFGLPDDNQHSPNEKLHLPTYYRGIEAYVRLLSYLSWKGY